MATFSRAVNSRRRVMKLQVAVAITPLLHPGGKIPPPAGSRAARPVAGGGAACFRSQAPTTATVSPRRNTGTTNFRS